MAPVYSWVVWQAPLKLKWW